MEPTHVLFVCSRNQWRSPTAERVFAHDPSLSVRSAGTSKRANRTVSERDVIWANVVISMEHAHRDRMTASFPDAMRGTIVHVLDIPDDYGFMDPELVAILELAVPPLLEANR